MKHLFPTRHQRRIPQFYYRTDLKTKVQSGFVQPNLLKPQFSDLKINQNFVPEIYETYEFHCNYLGAIATRTARALRAGRSAEAAVMKTGPDIKRAPHI